LRVSRKASIEAAERGLIERRADMYRIIDQDVDGTGAEFWNGARG